MPKLMDGLMAVDAKSDFNQSKLKPAGVVGDDCIKWIDAICDAIGDAHEKWRMGAVIHSILINGNMAIGGQIGSMPLEPFIIAKAPRKGIGDKAFPYAQAVARAVSSAWDEVSGSFKVAAPWYPTFLQVPGPVAPPTVNVPWPAEPCLIGAGAFLSPPLLKERMKAALGKQDELAAELFESVAKGFGKHAMNWVKTQKIQDILGTGPTVGWAPPNSPIGQVSGGHTIPGPGFLS